jgi:2-keto-4-pentenoate hydratase/2-oxohepta-3-ene-1,7-dioic acid hydratase in catechol pathway
MAEKPELSKERKEEFVKGAALLAGATAAYTAAALDAKGYKPGGMPDAEARLAIAIAKQLPTDMKVLKEAIDAVVGYAKANNISMGDVKFDIG